MAQKVTLWRIGGESGPPICREFHLSHMGNTELTDSQVLYKVETAVAPHKYLKAGERCE